MWGDSRLTGNFSQVKKRVQSYTSGANKTEKVSMFRGKALSKLPITNRMPYYSVMSLNKLCLQMESSSIKSKIFSKSSVFYGK